MDFVSCDVEQWRKVLLDYETHINNPKIQELDNFYRMELPRSLHARKPTSHITKAELVKLMEWKLSRGKWRPRLLSFVSSLDDEQVKRASEKAFAALPDLKEAIVALSSLKGIGPATASAIVAAFAPEIAPFMSDEAMAAALGSSNQYTLKQYLAFAHKLQNKAKELNTKGCSVKGGDNVFFTASDIERALWSAAMAIKKMEDVSRSKGRTNSKESNGQSKKRKF